jgi:protease I
MSRIAIVAFSEFEDGEVALPWKRFRERGHEVEILSPGRSREIEGREEARVRPDESLEEATGKSFDALLLPGSAHPERMRESAETIGFVRRFVETGRPVAAIEEGIELLRVAGVLEGVQVTSPPAFRQHLQNAGACWVNRDLVVDGPIVTARDRSQLQAFCVALEALLTGSTGGREEGGDDGLLEALEALATALVTPIVPGEAEAWLEEVQRSVETTARRFDARARGEHAAALQRIGEVDPALLHRVTELEAEADDLREGWEKLRGTAGSLERALSDAAPDEARAHGAILSFCQKAFTVLLRTRRQDAAVRTWTLEAFDRDRGGGD